MADLDLSHKPGIVYATGALFRGDSPAKIVEQLSRNAGYPRWTREEREEIVREAVRNQQAASELGESYRTVQHRREAAFRKGGALPGKRVESAGQICKAFPERCDENETVGIRVIAEYLTAQRNTRHLTVVVNVKAGSNIQDVLDRVQQDLVGGNLEFPRGSGQAIVAAKVQIATLIRGGYDTGRNIGL